MSDAGFAVTVLDLPGFGGSAPGRVPASIATSADFVARFVHQRSDDEVTLVGHSLGSAIAAEAATRLGARCSGLVSFEGNLTPADAYFSGQAADYDDSAEFARVFSAQIDQLVAAGGAPRSYAAAVRNAHSDSMWSLGRDASTRGASGDFGRTYLALKTRTKYLWAAATTPPETQRYLAAHPLAQHRLSIDHHWPWTVDPAAVTSILTAFMDNRFIDDHE